MKKKNLKKEIANLKDIICVLELKVNYLKLDINLLINGTEEKKEEIKNKYLIRELIFSAAPKTYSDTMLMENLFGLNEMPFTFQETTFGRKSKWQACSAYYHDGSTDRADEQEMRISLKRLSEKFHSDKNRIYTPPPSFNLYKDPQVQILMNDVERHNIVKNNLLPKRSQSKSYILFKGISATNIPL